MKAAALQIIRSPGRQSVLIPNHDGWHPLDHVKAPEWIPLVWIGPHCGVRLIEAFKTPTMLPATFGPRTFRNAGPHYKIEWKDLLAREQAEREDKELRAEAINWVAAGALAPRHRQYAGRPGLARPLSPAEAVS
jgi:hypothetical protein